MSPPRAAIPIQRAGPVAGSIPRSLSVRAIRRSRIVFGSPASTIGGMSTSPEELEAPQPPRGHVRVVYLGPVAPHWDVHSEFGERAVIEEFRQRALARLLLLPPHDPQFRRNRERVVRDAERENLILEWDLGVPDEELETAER